MNKTLIIGKYPTGALSILLEGDISSWPIKNYREVNLDNISALADCDSKEKELIKDLSYCLGIQRHYSLLRPNGFNVIPDGNISEKIVVKQLIEITKKHLDGNIKVENRIN